MDRVGHESSLPKSLVARADGTIAVRSTANVRPDLHGRTPAERRHPTLGNVRITTPVAGIELSQFPARDGPKHGRTDTSELEHRKQEVDNAKFTRHLHRSSGVCSALVSSDDTGVQDVEYRTISADLGTQTDPGDLALSAIGLMTTQVPDRRIEPDAIAVAYRTESQAAAVRSAAKSQKRAIRLVPETAATLTYLRSTGLVAQYGIIALVDLGASGLTVTIVDQADGTVFFRDRTAAVSADAAAHEMADEAGSRAAEFVAEAFAQALQRPEALVLVGGGGRIPGIASALESTFDAATIAVPEPEAATAKGAALLAGSPERQKFPLVTGSGGRSPVHSWPPSWWEA
ncbi:hypothetical protein GS506_17545 [Rhodococcus hoagii]|nr:hypothetical protein [Prescottella equi]